MSLKRPKDVHGGNIWLAAKASGIRPEDVVDFSASINPLGPPAGVVEAIEWAMKLLGPYPEPGALDLRRAIAGFHDISPEEVVAGNGSTELIYAIPRLVAPGARALIVEPAFSEYRASLALSNVRARGFVLNWRDGFRLCKAALEKRVKKGGYSLLYLANPANPTGAIVPAAEVMEVAAIAKRHGALVVIDEAFADFSACPADASVVREAVRTSGVVVLRSMTKFYSLAGLRLGYAACSKKTAARLSRLIPPWSVNTLAAFAGKAALEDASFRARTLKWLSAERARLHAALADMDGISPFPSSANYIMFRADGRATALPKGSLAGALAKRGILIRDLSAFHGLGPGFYRVAVLDRARNDRLVSALRETAAKRAGRRAERAAALD